MSAIKKLDAFEDLRAFYSSLEARAELIDISHVRDEISKLDIETYITEEGLKYRVILRDDIPIMILLISQVREFCRTLKRRTY